MLALKGTECSTDYVSLDTLNRLLPYEKLFDNVVNEQLHRDYVSARPYPHICLDDYFDAQVLDKINSEFPDFRQLGTQFDNKREKKAATKSESELPPFTRVFIHALNSAPFINFLQTVTGIHGLIPDPLLVGGGLHVLPPGGKLAIHTDFNWHRHLKLDRRVNVLIYLNRDWQEHYGGQFEAWAKGGKAAGASYLPIFNRLVIFGTNDYTFHGNPDPVRCPNGVVRKSIAMYYYTNGRPDEEWCGIRQSTRFMDRPGEQVTERERLRLRVLRMLPKKVRMFVSRTVIARLPL